MAVLAGELQPLRVVLVHLKRHITGSCGGFHSLVILQAGLDPVIVQLLGRLVQDELEVDLCAPVFVYQLDKARCATSLTPEALAGLAGPSSTGHSRLFHLQFPWTDTTEDETAICSAPKRVNVLVAKVVFLVLGAAYGTDVGRGKLRVLVGARGYRSSLQSIHLQCALQKAVDLRLGVAQVLVNAFRLVMGDQRHPPELAVAAPGNLDLDHAVRPDCCGQQLKDVRKLLESLQGQSDPFVTYSTESHLLFCVLHILFWQVQNNGWGSGQEDRGRQETADLLVEQANLLLRLGETESHTGQERLDLSRLLPVRRQFCEFPLRAGLTTRGMRHQTW